MADVLELRCCLSYQVSDPDFIVTYNQNNMIMNIETVLYKIMFFILIGIKLSSQTKRIFGGFEAKERKILNPREKSFYALTKQKYFLINEIQKLLLYCC